MDGKSGARHGDFDDASMFHLYLKLAYYAFLRFVLSFENYLCVMAVRVRFAVRCPFLNLGQNKFYKEWILFLLITGGYY
jgi:hypothetical protein